MRVLGLFIDYAAHSPFLARDGEDLFFLVFNSGGGMAFTLPAVNRITAWIRVLDTAADDPFTAIAIRGSSAEIAPASVSVFVAAVVEADGSR